MTAEEQKKMQGLDAENAALKERLLVAQRSLAKYAQMLFGQKTEKCRLPEKPGELTGSLFGREMDPAERARLRLCSSGRCSRRKIPGQSTGGD